MWVKYHSKEWESHVEHGWITCFVEFNGMVYMIRDPDSRKWGYWYNE